LWSEIESNGYGGVEKLESRFFKCEINRSASHKYCCVVLWLLVPLVEGEARNEQGELF
jgi:hypothetical protein